MNGNIQGLKNCKVKPGVFVIKSRFRAGCLHLRYMMMRLQIEENWTGWPYLQEFLVLQKSHHDNPKKVSAIKLSMHSMGCMGYPDNIVYSQSIDPSLVLLKAPWTRMSGPLFGGPWGAISNRTPTIMAFLNS